MNFIRSKALLGDEKMARIQSAHIAVVGVGGVGSWCAEALVRTGILHLTLIDDDVVNPSNINRQCPATIHTLGCPKVEAMRERLLEINPEAEITALQQRVTADTLPTLLPILQSSNFIIDAIDSVDCKAELILAATAAKVPLVSSMGAALRVDPTKVVVKRFDKVEGDGLARALRQRFKKLNRFPATKFNCVCSTELHRPFDATSPLERSQVAKPSYMPVTCAFGMALAAEALKMLAHNSPTEETQL